MVYVEFMDEVPQRRRSRVLPEKQRFYSFIMTADSAFLTHNSQSNDCKTFLC